MKFAHIVAAAQNNVIGKDGDLPWNIPEDLKFFKDKTKGHAMIMGRKTWESVGHPLPKRLNVIVTRQKDYKAEGAHVVSNIDEAIKFCEQHAKEYGDVVYIIGGEEIFRQTMDKVDLIYLTRIHKDYEGDTYYPEFNEDQFKLTDQQDRKDPVPFTFLTYQRVRTDFL